MTTRKILVAYDFSEVSDRALAWAAELAKERGAEVTLFYVVALPPPAFAPDAMVPVTLPTDADAQSFVPKLQAAAQRAGLPDARAESLVATNAGSAIVARAGEIGADLVVLGTHGRGALARALLGSVAEHVVRHADCPVVTFRARK